MDQDTEKMQAELELLRAENAQLKNKQSSEKTISCKVSPKGGVSVYGLGRFPVTLYKEQWHKLLEKKDDILDFINENEESLKSRN